ncbi:MAG: hypothetical protein KHZ54_05630 [Erysipelotrichaceae bacterium]|nr:hypothetical protein [Erysipelotrichaceae bacterium]QSI26078.1 hypothetical protein GKZ87_11565 [Erysipelotrichaceae bacterium 66202529]
MHTRVHKKSKKTVEKNNRCDIINNGANTHTTHIMDSAARALRHSECAGDKLLPRRSDGGVTESEDISCQ